MGTAAFRRDHPSGRHRTMRRHGRGWHSDQRKSRASAYFQNLFVWSRCGPPERQPLPSAGECRKSLLTDDEITLFWTRSSQPPVSPRVGLALKIAILTAARAGEVAGMREEEFADIDFA